MWQPIWDQCRAQLHSPYGSYMGAHIDPIYRLLAEYVNEKKAFSLWVQVYSVLVLQGQPKPKRTKPYDKANLLRAYKAPSQACLFIEQHGCTVSQSQHFLTEPDAM